MALIRALNEHDVQVDVVPRLFEIVGPRATVHTIEGLPLLNVPPGSLPRFSFALKRAFDIIGAGLLLVLSAPLFAYAALRVRLDSAGPVLYRQRRLGLNMREFTALKFRTMRVGTDDAVHREFVRGIMSSGAALGAASTSCSVRTP
jgi:lipopolysaccharide/colanic/teichoic acid biosynthesis glycosyltransferase